MKILVRYWAATFLEREERHRVRVLFTCLFFYIVISVEGINKIETLYQCSITYLSLIKLFKYFYLLKLRQERSTCSDCRIDWEYF